MSVDQLFQGALVIAAMGLAVFCLTLARRLRRLNDLETGLGGAIAVMAAEVDRLEQAIRAARDEAGAASRSLAAQIATARHERDLWDLRQRMSQAADAAPDSPARRLRKRLDAADG